MDTMDGDDGNVSMDVVCMCVGHGMVCGVLASVVLQSQPTTHYHGKPTRQADAS